MSKQRGKPQQRERQAAPGHHDKTRKRTSIAGERWHSGPHETADRKRAVRRIDSFDRATTLASARIIAPAPKQLSPILTILDTGRKM